MKYVCGQCGKEEETELLLESWVIPKIGMCTEKPEIGQNPLGHGVIRAFCSSGCEDKYRKKFYQESLLQPKTS